MDPGTIAKRISRYESGIITAREWANSLLYDLVSEPELDSAFVSTLASLPQEVGREFRGLLKGIEEAGFRRTPFFVTSSIAPSDPTEYSAQLRRVCALLRPRQVGDGGLRQEGPGSRETVGAGQTSGTPADPD
jgi:hypothetical protein